MFVTRLSSLLLLLSIPLTVLSATVPALERRDAVAASTVSGTCSSIQKRQEWYVSMFGTKQRNTHHANPTSTQLGGL